MTTSFRACIGPSNRRTHIRSETPRYNGDNVLNTLVLCEATAPVRDVSGAVPHSTLCLRCLTKMAFIIKADKDAGFPVMICDTPDGLAVAIGVEKIT